MTEEYSDPEPELEAIRRWWDNLERTTSLGTKRALLVLVIVIVLWVGFLVYTYPFGVHH